MASLQDKQARRKFVERKPRDAVAAEIGVLHGGFSLLALEYAKPREYHMIDCWKQQTGEYANDPSNYSQNEMNKMYRSVKDKFQRYERDDGVFPDVHIHRKYSSDAVTSFPDNHFDWVYIDADHTYKGIKADLGLWWPKVKPGGFLAGHDYHEKASWVQVKKAVDEFLKDNDLKLEFISTARYPDWAVAKPKNSAFGGTSATTSSLAYPLKDSITMVPGKTRDT